MKNVTKRILWGTAGILSFAGMLGAGYCFIFFAWLTAYYTTDPNLHIAQVRANLYFYATIALFVFVVLCLIKAIRKSKPKDTANKNLEHISDSASAV